MHLTQQKILDLVESVDISTLSLRELGEMVGEMHPQKIKHHLNQLFLRGFLKKNGTTITQANSNNDCFFSVPIVGIANCGVATTFANENIEGYLTLSKSMLSCNYIRNKTFAIKTVGNSMNKVCIQGKNIEEGDYVIIDSTERDFAFYNNKYVLSIIHGLANIKKLIVDKKNSRIALISESSENYSPIFIHENDLDFYKVNGVVTNIIKKIPTSKETDI